MPTRTGSWQRNAWPGASRCGSGIVAAQVSSARWHRVRKGQPLGGPVAEGTGPVSGIGSIGDSRPGVAANSA
ncbi:hypothetical protein A8926_4999 [Saccharopolyspora spinosa]|uniref:Uncharacterized protein n=1 Tax=Saccharopolyspora spinosa TaxID=60894 RepID=A0A2N3Y2J6_SACSN|nr:hypothetical protein A8926_4999 [Saccharopolyspora spinosa]